MEKRGWNKYGTEYRVIEHFDGPDSATGVNLAPRCAWQDSRQFLAFGANTGGLISTLGIANWNLPGRRPVMLAKEQIVKLLRENYPYLAAEYGVKKVGIFGSYAKGTPEETSDVDIIVEFERPIGFKFVEFAEYLEHLLDRKVDVLTPAGLQGIRVARVAQDITESIHSQFGNY